MGVLGHIKRLLRHSAIYGIGHMASRGLGFLLLPLHTNAIPAGEYGKAALIFSFLAIMNVVYGYGMDVAFLRFVALQEDVRKQRLLFSTGMISLLATSVLLSVLLIVLHRPTASVIFRSTAEANLILMSSGILLFDALTLLPFMVLRAKERSKAFVILKLASVIINVAANVYFIIILNQGVAGIFVANLLSSFVTLILVIPIILKHFVFEFDKSMFRELIGFGLPYIPTGLAVVAMNLIDRFILERLTGFETTGIYSAGYKLGSFMALFIAAFRFAWHPFFLSVSSQPKAKTVFSRVLTYFMLACSTVFLVISLFIDEIVRLQAFGVSLFGEEYWQSTSIIPLILISNIFYGIYVNFYVGIFLEKKTSVLPGITAISAGVNIGLNFLLIPFFGMLGAAWATVAAYGLLAALLYRKSNALYPIPYEWGRIMKVSVLALGLFMLQIYLFHFENPWIKGLLIPCFFILLWFTKFPDPIEKARLRSALGRRNAIAD